MSTIVLATDIAAYLVAQGIGLIIEPTANANLFVGVLPNDPDACTALIEGAGRPPYLTMDTLVKVDQPGLQIRARDPVFPSGYATVMAIFKALHGLTETQLVTNGAYVHSIWALQSPVHLGRDVNQRHEWSFNLHVEWENVNR